MSNKYLITVDGVKVDLEKYAPNFNGCKSKISKFNLDNDTLLQYTEYNSTDTWTLKKGGNGAINIAQYFKEGNTTESYAIDESTKPQFIHRAVALGPAADNANDYFTYTITPDATNKCLHFVGPSTVGTLQVTDSYGTKIMPKRIIIVLQAAGGGGGGAVTHYWTNTNGGGGGGSGACCWAIVDSSEKTWTIKLGRAGSEGGYKNNAEYYATSAKDSTISNSSSDLTITCTGGGSGGNGPQNDGTGSAGAAGTPNIIGTAVYKSGKFYGSTGGAGVAYKGTGNKGGSPSEKNLFATNVADDLITGTDNCLSIGGKTRADGGPGKESDAVGGAGSGASSYFGVGGHGGYVDNSGANGEYGAGGGGGYGWVSGYSAGSAHKGGVGGQAIAYIYYGCGYGDASNTSTDNSTDISTDTSTDSGSSTKPSITDGPTVLD